MLSILPWSAGLSPKGVVGRAESASRKGGMPLSSGLFAGFTERIPTIIMGTMRPSTLTPGDDEDGDAELGDVFGADDAVAPGRTGAGEGVPKRNIRKKFKGV